MQTYFLDSDTIISAFGEELDFDKAAELILSELPNGWSLEEEDTMNDGRIELPDNATQHDMDIAQSEIDRAIENASIKYCC